MAREALSAVRRGDATRDRVTHDRDRRVGALAGCAGGYTPLHGTFEEGPIGRSLAEHGIDTALEHGVWGLVLCSNAAPHHPMWQLRDWQREVNERILTA